MRHAVQVLTRCPEHGRKPQNDFVLETHPEGLDGCLLGKRERRGKSEDVIVYRVRIKSALWLELLCLFLDTLRSFLAC